MYLDYSRKKMKRRSYRKKGKKYGRMSFHTKNKGIRFTRKLKKNILIGGARAKA
jgi:hypothetical protein